MDKGGGGGGGGGLSMDGAPTSGTLPFLKRKQPMDLGFPMSLLPHRPDNDRSPKRFDEMDFFSGEKKATNLKAATPAGLAIKKEDLTINVSSPVIKRSCYFSLITYILI